MIYVHILKIMKKKKKKLNTVTGMERGKTANGCREKVMWRCDAPTSRRRYKMAGKSPEARRQVWNRPSLTSLRRNQPYEHPEVWDIFLITSIGNNILYTYFWIEMCSICLQNSHSDFVMYLDWHHTLPRMLLQVQ